MDLDRSQRLIVGLLGAALGIAVLLSGGCAGTYPVPTQHMADVESANRSATELGAQNNPQAQLYLKLADEQLQQAKAALKNDDNMNADRLLMRAKVDAELAIALTRGVSAKIEADKAVDTSKAARVTIPTGATP